MVDSIQSQQQQITKLWLQVLKYIIPALVVFLVLNSVPWTRTFIGTGYADLVAIQTRADETTGPFDKDHSLTQTFVSGSPNLSGIKLSFHNIGLRQGAVNQTAKIVTQLEDNQHKLLASSTYAISLNRDDFDIDFAFPAQSDSLGKKYSVILQTDAPPDAVLPWTSSFDAYTDGEFFSAGSAYDRDLTFQTFSSPPYISLISETLRASLGRLGSLLIICLAYFTLGFLIIVLLQNGNSFSLSSAAVYALPFGLAFPPIIFFLLSLIGIPLLGGILYVLVGILFLAAMIKAWRIKLWRSNVHLPWGEILALGLLLGACLLTRLVQINSLIVPNWIDGYTHQRILAQIAATHELPAGDFYHLGFHSNVIFVQSLINANLPTTALLFGQFLSAVSGLCLYPLAKHLFRNARLAQITVALYWFAAPFPAYLITWARYPFLQGLVLLPAAAAVCIQKDLSEYRRPLLAILLLGLLLSHYGVFLYAAIFMALVFIHDLYEGRYAPSTADILAKGLVFVPILIVIGIKFFQAVQIGTLPALIANLHSKTTGVDILHLFSIMLTQAGLLILVLAGFGMIFTFVAHRKYFILLFGWGFFTLFISWAQERILGITAFSIQNSIIFLTIPLCLLSGYAFVYLFTRENGLIRYTFSLALIFILVVGSYNISAIINPQTVLFSSADRSAMKWVVANTPARSLFLVNSFLWEGTYVPSDGGAWLSNETSRPNVYLGKAELLANLDRLVTDRNIAYVYLGHGFGILQPFIFNDPKFSLAYYKDGVRIYRVNP